MVAANDSTDIGADVVSLDDLIDQGRLAKAIEAAGSRGAEEEEREEVASFYEEEDRAPAAAHLEEDEECDADEQQHRTQFPRSDESFFQERRAEDDPPEERPRRFPRSDESFFQEVRPSSQAAVAPSQAEAERSPRSRPSVLASATSFVATGDFAEKAEEDERPRPGPGALPSAKSFVVSLGKADAGALVTLDAVDELLGEIEKPDEGVPMDPNAFRMAALRMAAAAAAVRSPKSSLSPASTPRRRRRTVGWDKEAEEEDSLPRQTSTKMLPSGEVEKVPSSPKASGEGEEPGEAGEVGEAEDFAREATAPVLFLDNVAAQDAEPDDGAIGSPGGGCVQVVHKAPKRHDELALVEAPTFDFEALGITEADLRPGPLVSLGPSTLATTKTEGGGAQAPSEAIVAVEAVDSRTFEQEQLDLVAVPRALGDPGRGAEEEADVKIAHAPAVGPGEHLGQAYLRHCNWNFAHIQSYGRPSGDAHYDMARCLSLGCGAPGEEGAEPSSAPGLPPCLPSATAEELLEARLDLATEMLRSAAVAGFADAARAEGDEDLAAVARRRPRQFATILRRMRGEAVEELAVIEDCVAAAAETAAEAKRLLAEGNGGGDDDEDGSSSSSGGSETGEEEEDSSSESGASGSEDEEEEDGGSSKKKVSGEDDSENEEDDEAGDTFFTSWRAFSSSFKRTFGWSF